MAVGGDPEVLYVGRDHCVAIHRNMLIAVADSDPLPSFATLLPGFLRRLRAQSAGPLGFFVVLPPHNPPPKEEARATIKAAFHIFSEHVAFGAFAIEMTGFLAAGQRSVVNLIMHATRPPFAMRIFGTVAEASQWVVSRQGREPAHTAAELRDAVEWVKAGYAAKTVSVPLR